MLGSVPSFCRHNRLIQNCAICSREQDLPGRPLVSPSTPRSAQPRPGTSAAVRERAPRARGSRASGVSVRRVARGEEDGYGSALLPGLRSSTEAQRLAEELAFATARLERLAAAPPGLYAEVADRGAGLEERTWLAFLIAYLCPTDDEDPFAGIRAARSAWAGAEGPRLDDVATLGPRSAHEPARGERTLAAYRVWVARAGSQAAAFGAESSWSAQRRFERVYERLALPGLHRDARFDLLVTLGATGCYELAAGALKLGGTGETTLAAKRALGIGDPLLLERRCASLSEACEVPLAALDLALYNWGRGERAHVGVRVPAEEQVGVLARVSAALGL